jgi:hypothetical protein
LIDSFTFAPLVKGVGRRRQGSWEGFVGMFYCFGMHTPPKVLFLGIWEHLLASKMLLGRLKPLPRMGASLK